MLVTTTEYVVRRVRRGVCQSQHGPYNTLEKAEQQKRSGEGSDDSWTDHWIIMERSITDWKPLPLYKDVGDMGQLND